MKQPLHTTRLSTKGQVVLPLQLRASHAWETGTEFIVEETSEGVLLRPVHSGPETTLAMVAGSLRRKGRPKTLAQMRLGIEREVKKRHKLGRS